MRQKGEKREELVAKMKRWINFVLIKEENYFLLPFTIPYVLFQY